jgi:GNAT superfamily N-acetyltransferase
MNLFWSSFLRHAAGQSDGGSIRQFGGLEAAWVHSLMPINNATYLAGPVASEVDMRARFASAVEDAAPRQQPWAFFLYEPYTASLSPEQVAAAAAEFGLANIMGVEVMTGDAGALQPPRRSLPELEFRRVNSREDCWIVFDINIRCYDMPPFMTDSIVEANAYYKDPQREFGFVAYADGVPASTASVIELDGWLYVALVATEPGQRQKGYAEAVMRHALTVAAAELGVSRTALDASAMGAPLYLQMGYEHTGESWRMYMAH